MWLSRAVGGFLSISCCHYIFPKTWPLHTASSERILECPLLPSHWSSAYLAALSGCSAPFLIFIRLFGNYFYLWFAKSPALVFAAYSLLHLQHSEWSPSSTDQTLAVTIFQCYHFSLRVNPISWQWASRVYTKGSHTSRTWTEYIEA